MGLVVAVRLLPALLVLSGCVLPGAGQSDQVDRPMNAAQSIEAYGAVDADGDHEPPDSCAGEQQMYQHRAKNVFMGQGSGAWHMGGRGTNEGFFISMADGNDYAPGLMFVSLTNFDGRSADLTVGAFGVLDDYSETFEGPDWEAASTAERAAKVKAVLLRFAGQLVGQCGAKLSSLDEEIATFEQAFKLFDQRGS